VPLLISVIFPNEVQVVTANGNCSLHLVGFDNALENAATDADIPSKRALLVDVLALDGVLGSLETQADVLEPAPFFGLLASDGFAADEDHRLLLERTLNLFRHFEGKGETKGESNVNQP